jgi:hypothetical protein
MTKNYTAAVMMVAMMMFGNIMMMGCDGDFATDPVEACDNFQTEVCEHLADCGYTTVETCLTDGWLHEGNFRFLILDCADFETAHATVDEDIYTGCLSGIEAMTCEEWHDVDSFHSWPIQCGFEVLPSTPTEPTN